MPKFTEDTIRKIANLARLELLPNEITKFSSQLEHILEYIEKLNTLDTSKVEPLTHPFALATPLRQDNPRPGLGAQNILESAPEHIYENYKVPQVMGG